MDAPALVVGRFPPPMDGQALATERCAAALEASVGVVRLNTQAPGPDPLTATPRFDARRTLHYLRLRSRLREALRRHATSPVLWHALSPAPLGHVRDVVATASAFSPGQPVAGVMHRAGFEALFRSPTTSITAARLVRRLDVMVFQCAAVADRCAGVIPASKRRVIPNTVRDAAVPPAEEVEARRRRGPGRPFHVLFLSNMLPEKGYHDVLAAVAVLAGRGVDVRATFAGRWPSDDARRHFLAAAGQLGVAERVDVLGGVADPAEVRRLHLDADAFALPSTHPTESQPVSVLEALAAGTPVIAVDRPVMRDILTDGVEGALVAADGSGGTIAEAVVALSDPDRWRAASAAARRRFDAAFSADVVAEQWRALVHELAAGRGSGAPAERP